MARVVITSPADADSTEIIRDLTAKAGELVADRYEADFDALYLRLATFPKAARHAPSLAASSALALFRLMETPNNYQIDRVSNAPSVIARSPCDEAIQGPTSATPGLLRFARNDGGGVGSLVFWAPTMSRFTATSPRRPCCHHPHCLRATPDHPPHPDATDHAPMIYGYARVSPTLVSP